MPTKAQAPPSVGAILQPGQAVAVFAAFALAYFFSAVLRAATATLAPELTQVFRLTPGDLGLLAGGYFLGFAAMQLPLGTWLDRFGPKRVILGFLCVAVLGCAAFATATQFVTLLAARMLCGVGVCACLMAPLTAYRRWFAPAMQLRANSWMLMSGSLGMVASTLPVAYLTPILGWRGLFWLIAGLVVVCILILRWVLPAWGGPALDPDPHAWAAAPSVAAPQGGRNPAWGGPALDPSPHALAAAPSVAAPQGGRNPAWGGPALDPSPHALAAAPSVAAPIRYRDIFTHPYFRKMSAIGFFNYGGMVGIQSLWAGPWMVKVGGLSAQQAAGGLFWVNVCMLLSFMLWGWLNPGFARRGWSADYLIARGLPLSLLALLLAIVLGTDGHWGWWALFCTTSTFTSLTQPAVGMAFEARAVGRALSAYNLLIFSGVFVTQWGIGLVAGAALDAGWSPTAAYQAAMLAYLVCCLGAYLHFLLSRVPARR